MCEKKRCRWAAGSEEMIRYHDQEWGTPQHDDAKLFELFLLEGFQAGLSWAIVLKKREAFRRALDGFDAEKIAAYGEEKIQSLLQDESIIRSERKLRAAVVIVGKVKLDARHAAKLRLERVVHIVPVLPVLLEKAAEVRLILYDQPVRAQLRELFAQGVYVLRMRPEGRLYPLHKYQLPKKPP